MNLAAKAHSDFVDAVRSLAVYLDGIAETVDGWADESRRGGWSTHQVDANHRLADDCRRRAAELRRINQ